MRLVSSLAPAPGPSPKQWPNSASRACNTNHSLFYFIIELPLERSERNSEGGNVSISYFHSFVFLPTTLPEYYDTDTPPSPTPLSLIDTVVLFTPDP